MHAYINPSAQETAKGISQGLGLDLNSFIYDYDPETGAEQLYETIKGTENRIWVDSEEMPEDTEKRLRSGSRTERLYQRHGVRTGGVTLG